jgi:hypothetical protein
MRVDPAANSIDSDRLVELPNIYQQSLVSVQRLGTARIDVHVMTELLSSSLPVVRMIS